MSVLVPTARTRRDAPAVPVNHVIGAAMRRARLRAWIVRAQADPRNLAVREAVVHELQPEIDCVIRFAVSRYQLQEAERCDALSDAYLGLVCAIDRYDSRRGDAPDIYARASMVHAIQHGMRRRALIRQREVSWPCRASDGEPVDFPDPEDARLRAMNCEIDAFVARALPNRRTRAVFLLRVFWNYSIPEIAINQRISPSTVTREMAEARRSLKNALLEAQGSLGKEVVRP